MLTQAQLKEELYYDESDGSFHWIKRKKGRRLDGTVGTVSNFGYRIIWVDGKRYTAGRLAWLYVYGQWPVEEIDHINGDKLDNRIANLRDVSRAENAANIINRVDNNSGCPGVCWDKQKLKWKVQISFNGAKRHQKHFENFDDAARYYKETARALFGEFASRDKVL